MLAEAFPMNVPTEAIRFELRSPMAVPDASVRQIRSPEVVLELEEILHGAT